MLTLSDEQARKAVEELRHLFGTVIMEAPEYVPSVAEGVAVLRKHSSPMWHDVKAAIAILEKHFESASPSEPRRGFEIKPITFKGPTYRAQLSVSDYRDGVIEKWKNNPVRFNVQRLSNSYPRSTPFSCGDQIYFGEDLASAVFAIEKIVRRQVWPCEFHKDWHRYAHPDSDKFREKLERLAG